MQDTHCSFADFVDSWRKILQTALHSNSPRKVEPMRKHYNSWPWPVRWLPFPILLWLSKRIFRRSHVWYQDATCQVVLMPFDGSKSYRHG